MRRRDCALKWHRHLACDKRFLLLTAENAENAEKEIQQRCFQPRFEADETRNIFSVLTLRSL